MDKTTLFEIEDITNALIETTLDEIYDALKEKGYPDDFCREIAKC